MNAVFMENNCCWDSCNIKKVYGDENIAKLKALCVIQDTIVGAENLEENKEYLQTVEYVFSTWGMPSLSCEQIQLYLPHLKAVFYAAGSVQGFAKPFLDCGVRVFSAWAANAVPVAEYTVAQIVLANTGFFQACAKDKKDHAEAVRYYRQFEGNYNTKVGIIGAGMIGRLVIEMLKAYRLQVLVFDPFLSEERAVELGVQKCELNELFASCAVISNHLANNPQTVGMIGKEQFDRMSSHATLINTGRGAQIVESELAQALLEQPDRTAILDVSYPEPMLDSNPLMALENVFLTPHIAGSKGSELLRMAEYMLAQFNNVINDAPVQYEVTAQMLKTMA